MAGECRWRAWERSVRSLAIWGAFICLALFYLVLAPAPSAIVSEIDRQCSSPNS